jgi:3-hydroxyacyl-CoA dehydrogenase
MGKAIAILFASEGAKVIASDINSEAVNAVPLKLQMRKVLQSRCSRCNERRRCSKYD